MANTRDPILKPIPILSLRPTQMTVGVRKVNEKRKRWREHKSEKKRAELLGKHMIPVVLGPDAHHYVVDHHHLARALHDEGVENVLVTVIGDLTMVEREAFWTVMDHKRWAYPYDAKGERRAFKDLPKSVSGLKDDRSAAWPGNCAASAALQRTSPRSANFCGRIFCAAKSRAKAWRRISTRRWKRRSASPGARARSICHAGGDPSIRRAAMSEVCLRGRQAAIPVRARPCRQTSCAASVPFGRQRSRPRR